ncbi:MAG: hypothetical protein AB8G05_25300 [Oligoflexales bacterium]
MSQNAKKNPEQLGQDTTGQKTELKLVGANSEHSSGGPFAKFLTNRSEEDPWKKETKEDFLYERKGPWPQPSPEHPMGQAPAVVHVPKIENMQFFKCIGIRYLWQTIAYTPTSFVQGLLKPGLEPVSDEEFVDILSGTIFAKLIKNEFDKKDLEIFGQFMSDDKKYCLVDMEAVKGIETFPDQYLSASKTLLIDHGDFKYEVAAISVYKSRDVFVPNDGDAWKLAKYYALQGAALVTTLLEHPLVHFPYDAINAVTKTAIPKDHILFRLIFPHTFLTLPLENAVLEGANSIISDKTYLPYTLYPGPGPQLKKMLVKGYMGIRGNDSYPKFTYPKQPRKPLSRYDVYLNEYFDEIYKFVDNILKDLDRNDHYVGVWAKYLTQFIPGFPDEKEISQGDNLVRAVAIYIWTVTVNHSVDHYNYGFLNLRKVPMRLRVAPPKKGMKLPPLRQLNNWIDFGKYNLANIMFYKSLTVAPLMEANYEFDEKGAKYLQEFRNNLIELDKKFTREGMNFMPLSKIGVSVQF